MAASIPRCPPPHTHLGKHGEGNREPKDHEKPGDHVFILWRTVSIASGSSLDLPWKGVTVWQAFLEVEFGLRQLPGEVAQNGCQGAGVKPPTKHFTLFV